MQEKVGKSSYQQLSVIEETDTDQLPSLAYTRESTPGLLTFPRHKTIITSEKGELGTPG